MSNFEQVKALSGFRGDARLFKDEESGRYIVISRASTFDRGDETMIFEATKDGKVSDWTDLYAGYGVDHKEALALYEAKGSQTPDERRGADDYWDDILG